MINILSSILFSLSANLDNIPIAISYGIKRIHISYLNIFLISFLTTLFTFISMLFGKYISFLADKNITHSIGAYLLIAIGLFSIIKEVISYTKTNRHIKHDDILPIRLIDTLSIVLILSTNNIAIGTIASATGLNIFLTIIFSFIFCFVFLLAGNIIGKRLTNKCIEKYCNIISSFILLIIGIIEIKLL